MHAQGTQTWATEPISPQCSREAKQGQVQKGAGQIQEVMGDVRQPCWHPSPESMPRFKWLWTNYCTSPGRDVLNSKPEILRSV